jgi:hypothetical protein
MEEREDKGGVWVEPSCEVTKKETKYALFYFTGKRLCFLNLCDEVIT